MNSDEKSSYDGKAKQTISVEYFAYHGKVVHLTTQFGSMFDGHFG